MTKQMSCRKFMISGDPGIDDAQAILMALARPDLDIISIHTHCGNTTRYNATRNTLRLLQASNRLEIPVYQGSDRALVIQLDEGDNYHGIDGFGDSPDSHAPCLDMIQKEHSVWAMIDKVKSHPGEITLVAMGPLTDLALAHRLYPQFSKQLKSCYIMGGNYLGKGNITKSAEFNVFFDPESTHIVLTEFQCQLNLFPWELCVNSGMSWDFHDNLRKKPGKKAELMRIVETKLLPTWKSYGPYVMCDELAMAGAIDESTVSKFEEVSIEVELRGQMTRGQLVIDWQNKSNNAIKTRLVTEINMDRVKQLLHDAYEN